MKIITKLLAISVVGIFLTAGNAFGIDFGDNITISDNHYNTGNVWYSDHEDEEVEPGMTTGQDWDLEGFFLEKNSLTMVGGYNFSTGNDDYLSGDIFIDINKDAQYGLNNNSSLDDGYHTVQDTFGYDYVLDLNFGSNEYSVYKLTSNSTLKTIYFQSNVGSNPWQYVDGGTWVNNGSFNVESYTDGTFGDTVLLGSTHYALSVDLSFLEPGQDFTAHFTMECGNDNLMGFGTTTHTPEPATMLLFGVGLLGMTVAQRKKVFTLIK